MLDPSRKTHRNIWLALIMLAALAVYARTLNYGLVNWDEPLAGIRLYQETPGLESFGLMLKPQFSATYQPVRAVASALLAPYGAKSNWVPYHVVSLIFYLGTALFLYLVAFSILRRQKSVGSESEAAAAALLASAIFALHPSHSEAAAWVTGQKDVFVGFFYLGALYFYIRHDKLSPADILLSMVFCILALGSKPSAVSLPLVMIAYDLTVRRAGDAGAVLRRHWPVYLLFLAPALTAVFYFVSTTARVGALWAGMEGSAAKAVKFLAACGFSSIKLLLPVNLCLRYPGFEMSASNPLIYVYSTAGLLLLGWTVRSLKRGEGPAAFLLTWFVVALAPNANLIRIQIERADRYYYLSSMAFAVLAAFGAMKLYSIQRQGRKKLLKSTVLAALVLLGALSWRQAGYWSDPLSAWSRVHDLYPDMILSKLGLASSHLRGGDFDEALRIYKPLLEGRRPNSEAIKGAIYISSRRGEQDKALQLARLGHVLDPVEEDFMATLARSYLLEGDSAAAGGIIAEWMERYPSVMGARMSLAALERMKGSLGEAAVIYQSLIEDFPRQPEPCTALAEIRMEQRRYGEAEMLYDKALATGRKTLSTKLQLAALYEKRGEGRKALELYSGYEMQELSMQGLEFMGAHYFLLGEHKRAFEHFQRMALKDSTLPRAYSNSAVVLEQMALDEQADSLYRLAIELDSTYVDAFFNRGNLLYRLGRPEDAAAHYSRADSLSSGADPAVIKGLMQAQAAAGDTAAARITRQRLEKISSGRTGGPGGAN
ncbi:MAG: tetratricopeptide repeat protein [Candidatus Glassbacteria bacterium]|nr:tetratricopeptide repeat protein [Candidatus Glassbacteria bacterium]